MKIYTGCIPCFARQAVESAEMVTDDPSLRETIIRKALHKIAELPFHKSPPYAGMAIHRVVRELLGNVDPYRDLKRKYNQKAMQLYPQMKEIVEGVPNSLETAARLAIAGNNIDFGIRSNDEQIDLHAIIDETMQRPFSINHMIQFAEVLESASSILYLADNAGEIVFDRVLIEEIPEYRKRVIFVVKGHPVLNDATMEDAEETGITEIVRVIDNGSDAPGTIVETCSAPFIEELSRADLIISKGQGNYETLSEEERNVFFLLKAKCPVIARDLGVQVGDIVLQGLMVSDSSRSVRTFSP